MGLKVPETELVEVANSVDSNEATSGSTQFALVFEFLL